MSLCIVGIGGCGGHLAEKFLENQDVALDKILPGTNARQYLTFGDVKGLWLEADVAETQNQSFFCPWKEALNDGYGPSYVVPHQRIKPESKLSKLIQEKYGYDIKKHGFVRESAFSKAVFEIFENDEEIKDLAKKECMSEDPIMREAWNCIRPYTTLSELGGNGNGIKLCDGILFVASLGGGTGTGFINPITSYIRAERKDYPVFVLGVLTERGTDDQQNVEEEKRDMGAVISLHDLITKKRGLGTNGLILIDNQVLIDKLGRNYQAIDDYIYQAMKPLMASRHYPGEDPSSTPLGNQFTREWEWAPLLVPCYRKEKRGKDPENRLVKKALKDGRLFGCDCKKADKVYVFSRGFLSRDKLIEAVARYTNISPNENDILPWRKLGDNRHDEILILLRNPYGKKGAFEENGTLENRLYQIIEMAMKYMKGKKGEILSAGGTDRTKKALETYFFGDNGLEDELKAALYKIEKGERPFFKDELKIFGKDQRPVDALEWESKIHAGLSEGEIRAIVQDEMHKMGY